MFCITQPSRDFGEIYVGVPCTIGNGERLVFFDKEVQLDDLLVLFKFGRQLLANDMRVRAFFPFISPYGSSYWQHLPNCFNQSSDEWTSENNLTLMNINTHYEKEGVMREHLLDMPFVPFSHTGRNLARTLKKVTNDFGITNKVQI